VFVQSVAFLNHSVNDDAERLEVGVEVECCDFDILPHRQRRHTSVVVIKPFLKHLDELLGVGAVGVVFKADVPVDFSLFRFVVFVPSTHILLADIIFVVIVVGHRCSVVCLSVWKH